MTRFPSKHERNTTAEIRENEATIDLSQPTTSRGRVT